MPDDRRLSLTQARSSSQRRPLPLLASPDLSDHHAACPLAHTLVSPLTAITFDLDPSSQQTSRLDANLTHALNSSSSSPLLSYGITRIRTYRLASR